MNFPADLPWILEYRMGTYNGRPVTRVTLPRRAIRYVSSSGNTDADEVCPTIPHGCTGWRRPPATEWQPLDALPRDWLRFLNRKRGSEMDPRPDPKEVQAALERIRSGRTKSPSTMKE